MHAVTSWPSARAFSTRASDAAMSKVPPVLMMCSMWTAAPDCLAISMISSRVCGVGADRRVAAVEEAGHPELLRPRWPRPASPRRSCPGRTPARGRRRSSPGGSSARAMSASCPIWSADGSSSTASPSSLYRIHGSSNAPPKLTRQLSVKALKKSRRVAVDAVHAEVRGDAVVDLERGALVVRLVGEEVDEARAPRSSRPPGPWSCPCRLPSVTDTTVAPSMPTSATRS